MFRIETVKLTTLLFSLFFVLALSVPGDAFFWNKQDTLATINGNSFSTEDFVHWWKEWQEPGMSVPETPQEFVDWMVLFQEAERMRLFENAAYREKVSIFLKVRSLMLLKDEEIIKKIHQPQRADLEGYYLDNYVPFMDIALLKIQDREKVAEAEKLLAAVDDLNMLAERSGLAVEISPVANMGRLRPLQLPLPFKRLTETLHAGQIGGPVFWEGAWYFIQVKAKDEKSLEGFERFEGDIRSKWLRNEENRLTAELIQRLKNKFNVSVDEEILEQIQPDGLSGDIAQKPVIKIGEQVINADTLYRNVTKDRQMRGKQRIGAQDEFKVSLRRVVADIVAQTVTSLEAADKHYENQPVLEPVYQFYCQHRMIKELEKELILPNSAISDEDVEDYYQSHAEEFERSEVAELAMVQTREKLLTQELAVRLKQGEDFFKVLEPLSPQGIPVQKLPIDHLPAPVQAALAELAPGQASGAIISGEDIYFVKLVRKSQRENTPLSEVSESIRKQLAQERFESLRANLLSQLRSRSEIVVDQDSWLKLRDRLLKDEHNG